MGDFIHFRNIWAVWLNLSLSFKKKWKKKRDPNNLCVLFWTLFFGCAGKLPAQHGHQRSQTVSAISSIQMTRKVPSAFWSEKPKCKCKTFLISGAVFWRQSFCASNWVRSAAMASALLKSKDTVEFSRLVWPAINATWSHISGDYTRWYKEWSRSVSRIPQILTTSS